MSRHLQFYAPEGLAMAAPKMFVVVVPAWRSREVTAMFAGIGFSRIAGSMFWQRGINIVVVLSVPIAAMDAARKISAGPSGTWGKYDVVLFKLGLAVDQHVAVDQNVGRADPAPTSSMWLGTRLQTPAVNGLFQVGGVPSAWVQWLKNRNSNTAYSARSSRTVTNVLELGQVDARTSGHCHVHPPWLSALIGTEFAVGETVDSGPRFFTTLPGGGGHVGPSSERGIAAYTMASRKLRLELYRLKYSLALGLQSVLFTGQVGDGEGGGRVPAAETAETAAANERGYDVWYDSEGEEIPELLAPSDSSDDEE